MSDNCAHDVVFRGLCAICGKTVTTDTRSSHNNNGNYKGEPDKFVIEHPALTVSRNEAQKLAAENTSNLLAVKKLSLVLDLDHTLIHATTEHHVKQQPLVVNGSDVIEFTLPPNPTKYYVKLRPKLAEFLRNMHRLYELHIYTMGTRQYAKKIAEIIDKDNVYFRDHRIISRDDCADHFFETTQEINQLPQDKDKPATVITPQDTNNNNHTTEPNVMKEDTDTYLGMVEDILTQVHSIFYQSLAIDVRDTKNILSNLRKQVLQGCEIVFSGLIPLHVDPHKADVWKMAEAFGAKCQLDLAPSVTHLIAAKPGTGKVTKALSLPTLMLYDSVKKWTRCDEQGYSVDGLPVRKEATEPLTEMEEERPQKKQKKEDEQKRAFRAESPPEDTYDSDRSLDQEDMEMANLIEQGLLEDDASGE